FSRQPRWAGVAERLLSARGAAPRRGADHDAAHERGHDCRAGRHRETLGDFIARICCTGIDPAHLRFRQQTRNEMAVFMRQDEIVARGAAGPKQALPEPKVEECVALDRDKMAPDAFKGEAGAVTSTDEAGLVRLKAGWGKELEIKPACPK
ncbi:hypothetical protein DFH06DRAFT_1239203, partial [Mycena polygramma]